MFMSSSSAETKRALSLQTRGECEGLKGHKDGDGGHTRGTTSPYEAQAGSTL